MSKKPLPKRTLAFKLEKHPTAERLEALRAQGIESIEDLDLLTSTTTSATDQTITNNITNSDNILLDQANVATDGSKTSPTINPVNILIPEAIASAIDKPIVNTSNEPIDKVINDLSSNEDIKNDFSLEIYKTNTSANNTPTTTSIPTFSHIPSDISQPIAADTDIVINSTPINQTELSFSAEDLFHKLQETHSASAQVIYKLLTDLVSQKARPVIRIGTKQLLEKTNIKSHVTVRKAIDELIVKLSLEIIEANQGKIPPVYKLISPEEVFSLRKKGDITIDEDTKFAFQLGQRLWPINSKASFDITSIDTLSDISIPIVSHTGDYITSPIIKKTQRLKDSTFLSKELLIQLKPVCDKLLIEISDSSELSILNNCPLPHIIIGICKSRKLQPSKTLSLQDCLSEILEHYKTMNALPETILSQIAYDQFATLSK